MSEPMDGDVGSAVEMSFRDAHWARCYCMLMSKRWAGRSGTGTGRVKVSGSVRPSLAVFNLNRTQLKFDNIVVCTPPPHTAA